MSRTSFTRLTTAIGSPSALLGAAGRGLRALLFGLLFLSWAGPVEADLIFRLSGLMQINSEVSVNSSSSADWYDSANPGQSSAFSVDLAWDETLSGLPVDNKDDTYYVPLLSDPFFSLEDPNLTGNGVREGAGLDMKIKYKSSYDRTEIEIKFDSGTIFSNLSDDTLYSAAHDIELNTGKEFKIKLRADGQYFTPGEAPTEAQFTAFLSNLNADDGDREFKLKWDDGGGGGAPKDPEVKGRITGFQVVPEPSGALLSFVAVMIPLFFRRRSNAQRP